jgi:signal peptidase II
MKWKSSFFFIFFGILGLDILTKWWIVHHLPSPTYSPNFPYGGIAVMENLFGGIHFAITHVINQGGAWGLFSSMPQALLTARMILVSFLFIYVLFFVTGAKTQLGMICILSGAIGNIIDYFIYGHVIDMFHFTFWGYSFPVFNVADSAICIGFALLSLFSLLGKKKTHAA